MQHIYVYDYIFDQREREEQSSYQISQAVRKNVNLYA